MPAWIFSSYAKSYNCDNTFFLVSSLSGTLIEIPDEFVNIVSSAIIHGIEEKQPDISILRDLISYGFFINVKDKDIEYYLLKEFLKKIRERTGPHITIMPTMDCNFRCSYCYETFNESGMTNKALKSLKKFFKRNVPKWPQLLISWFGGEPLLEMDTVFDLSMYIRTLCESNKIPFRFGMTTNGSLLSFYVFKKLLEHSINSFQITLDGPPVIHDMQRQYINGMPTYTKILENLVAMKNSNKKFSVRIRVNYDENSLDGIMDWLPNISKLVANDERFEIAFHAIWCSRYARVKHKTCDTLSARLFFNKLLACAYPDIKERLHHLKIPFPFSTVCYASSDINMVIGPDLSIRKCTVALDDPINKVGQIDENGNLSLSIEKNTLWSHFLNNYEKTCADCWYFPACQGSSCPLGQIQVNNRRPHCTHEKEMLDEVFQFIKKIK